MQAEQPGHQAPMGGAPGQQAPSNAELALGKGVQVGGAVFAAGVGVTKLGVWKGMAAPPRRRIDQGPLSCSLVQWRAANRCSSLGRCCVSAVARAKSFSSTCSPQNQFQLSRRLAHTEGGSHILLRIFKRKFRRNY